VVEEHDYGGLLGSGHFMKLSDTVFTEAMLNLPDDLAVNRAGDAVLKFEVHLRDSVFRVDGCIRDIT
jgi:hypothetical protein